MDKPENGKIYRLTAEPGVPCIAAGNNWTESEIQSEHTPGPWTIRQEKHGGPWYHIDAPGGDWVAQVAGPDSPNARLIAAAPDLLAALKTVAEAARMTRTSAKSARTVTSKQLADMINEAIAKAEVKP